jgi:hypothetical protein
MSIHDMVISNRKTDTQINSSDLAQIGLKLQNRERVTVDIVAVSRLPTFSAAITYCVGISGFDRKEVYSEIGIDAATWSRIESGAAYFPMPKLEKLMDICGNEVPLMWLVNSRNYEWSSLREKQTEMERKLAEKDRQLADYERTFRLMLSAQMPVATP